MADTQPDWTSGPAKLVAALVLGGAAIFGLAWSIATRAPAAAAAGIAHVNTPAAAPSDRPAPAPTPRIARRINLNTASAAEIELLPGIGPSLAQRIIEHRESRGPFRSINELDRVSGVGARIIERIRDKVTLE